MNDVSFINNYPFLNDDDKTINKIMIKMDSQTVFKFWPVCETITQTPVCPWKYVMDSFTLLYTMDILP